MDCLYGSCDIRIAVTIGSQMAPFFERIGSREDGTVVHKFDRLGRVAKILPKNAGIL